MSRIRLRCKVPGVVPAFAVAGGLLLFSVALPLAADPPNVLLIVVDDVGIEHLDFYDLQDDPTNYADTFNLSDRVTNGEFVTFTNAWSTPLCSSTRMWIQTGLYGFSTGAGSLINPEDEWQPDLGEDYFLADLLKADGYTAAAAFGKWHIGDDEDDAPALIGYDHYRVTYHKDFYSGEPNYFAFKYTMNTPGGPQKVEVEASSGKYLTDETAEWVIDWWEDEEPQAPWLAYVAFFASHHPWHCPPDEIYPTIVCDDGDDLVDKHHDMIFALDAEIERLLDAAPANTLIIIAGDNGSQGAVALPPVLAGKAKATVFQGGVRVPLLIGGAGVDAALLGTRFDDIVSLSDLYDTILDFGEADGPGGRSLSEDKHSVSLKPYLDGTDPVDPPRQCVYTEIFNPNGPPTGYSLYDLAVRGDEYKYLLKRASGLEGLFRLEGGADPDLWETDNLLNDAVPPLQEMYELQECGDQFFEVCTLRKQQGAECSDGAECCSGTCSAGECT